MDLDGHIWTQANELPGPKCIIAKLNKNLQASVEGTGYRLVGNPSQPRSTPGERESR